MYILSDILYIEIVENHDSYKNDFKNSIKTKNLDFLI